MGVTRAVARTFALKSGSAVAGFKIGTLGIIVLLLFYDIILIYMSKMSELPKKHIKAKHTNYVSDRHVSVDIPARARANNVQCTKLLSLDLSEQQRLKHSPREAPKTPQYYINATRNCSNFIKERKYINVISQNEANFPIAYSIVMYRSVERAERLLRSIYRPNNYYCIHVDRKSTTELHEAMAAIADCFHNVFLASRSIKVYWGAYSVLEAELICMRDLMRYKWRYFINLTGEEFPLRTNLELVEILRVFDGANAIAGSASKQEKWRTRNKKMNLTFPITLTKGSIHIVAQRGFIDFILHDKHAIELNKWARNVHIPDETYFSSLHYNPQLGAPGAYFGKPEMTNKGDLRNPVIARYKNWGGDSFPPCHGKRSRRICIFGYGDLLELATRKELFANKFYANFEPEAYDCLEEIYFNRTREQLLGHFSFNASFYKQFDFVRNHI